MNFTDSFGFILERQSLNALFGAGLGGAFYVLQKSRKYRLSQSFSPKYNLDYLIRFIIGLVSGFLLAMLSRSLLSKSDARYWSWFLPSVLAIVGGFSAEVVEQFQRMLRIGRGTGLANSQSQNAKSAFEVPVGSQPLSWVISFSEYTWRHWISFATFVVAVAFAIYCLWFFGNAPNEQKRAHVWLLGVWGLGPPAFFFLEYYFLWKQADTAQQQRLKAGRELAQPFWAAVGVLLALLYQGHD